MTSGSKQTFAGRYQIQHELASGGMGQVYACVDTYLNRPVAVKQLLPQSEIPGIQNERAYQKLQLRLKEEAQKAARVHHPSVVTVYDVGDEDGKTFVVYEFIPGPSLLGWKTQSQPIEHMVAVVAQIADALYHIHKSNVTHCDVKPDNIVFRDATDERGCPVPVLIDLGIARTLTRTASEYGTTSLEQGLPYSSPEQQLGQPLTERTDVYNLGIVLYQLLTRKSLSHLRPGPENAEWVGHERPLQWDGCDVPDSIQGMCERCVRYDPLQRYTSAAELRDDLRGWLTDRSSLVSMPAPTQSADVYRVANYLASEIVAAARGSQAEDPEKLKEFFIGLNDVYPVLLRTAPAAGQQMVQHVTRLLYESSIPNLSLSALSTWIHTQSDRPLLEHICELGITDSWLPRENVDWQRWKRFAMMQCQSRLATRQRHKARTPEDLQEAERLLKEVHAFIQHDDPTQYATISTIEYDIGQCYVTRGEYQAAIAMFWHSSHHGALAGNESSRAIGEFKVRLAEFQYEVVAFQKKPPQQARESMVALLEAVQQYAQTTGDGTARRFVVNIRDRIAQVLYEIGLSTQSLSQREQIADEIDTIDPLSLPRDWAQLSASDPLYRWVRLSRQARISHLKRDFDAAIETFATYLDSDEDVRRHPDFVEYQEMQGTKLSKDYLNQRVELAREYLDFGRAYRDAGNTNAAASAFQRGLAEPFYKANYPYQIRIERELRNLPQG